MKYLFIACLLVTCLCSSSQELDSLYSRIPVYARSLQPAVLFLQTDRHIYLNNEFIWFSGYIIQANDTLQRHELLLIYLVSADTRKPVLQQKFAMSNGLAYGNIRLPDSIPPGDYKLVACTNVIKKEGIPAAVFEQEINIRSITDPSFTAALITGANQQLMITVRDKATSMPSKAASIETWNGAHPMLKGSTDQNGVYYQGLQALGYDSSKAAIIRVRVKYKNEWMFLEKVLQAAVQPSRLQLHFFPESGNMINGLPCRIAVESNTVNGEPVPVQAVLYKNNIAFDTISTDAQGLGIFNVTPELHAVYKAMPIQLPVGVNFPDTGFSLPGITPIGMSIRLPAALAGDTMRFQIYSNGYTQVKMLIHNFQQVFELDSFLAKAGMRNIVLLLDRIPKGIAAITLLDDENRPIAERFFFAHYDRRIAVAIHPEKKLLGKRELLTVHFTLPPGLRNKAAFASVSCAQLARFNNGMQRDIEAFATVQQSLEDILVTPGVTWFNQQDFLERVLLVKGWRSYHWNDMEKSSPQTAQFYSPEIYGDIISDTRRKKDGLVILLGENAGRIEADEHGRAIFPYDKLYVSQDRQVLITASLKNEPKLQVKVTDPYLAIGDSIASRIHFKKIDVNRFAQYAEEQLLTSLVKQKTLKNVTVTVKKNDDAHFIGVDMMNKCGDYVCFNKILNCTNHVNHPGNRGPVPGRMYVINGMIGEYKGCALYNNDKPPQLYDGIKLGKEFYPEDFSKNPSPFPENLVTLYWSPGLYFDKDGSASCSFYTGDITGKFRIVINGTTGEDVFTASEVVEVR